MEKITLLLLLFIGIELIPLIYVLHASFSLKHTSHALIHQYNDSFFKWKTWRENACSLCHSNTSQERFASRCYKGNCYEDEIEYQIHSTKSHEFLRDRNVDIMKLNSNEEIVLQLEDWLTNYPKAWIPIAITAMLFSMIQFVSVGALFGYAHTKKESDTQVGVACAVYSNLCLLLLGPLLAVSKFWKVDNDCPSYRFEYLKKGLNSCYVDQYLLYGVTMVRALSWEVGLLVVVTVVSLYVAWKGSGAK